jgi:hypothetical protein
VTFGSYFMFIAMTRIALAFYPLPAHRARPRG